MQSCGKGTPTLLKCHIGSPRKETTTIIFSQQGVNFPQLVTISWHANKESKQRWCCKRNGKQPPQGALASLRQALALVQSYLSTKNDCKVSSPRTQHRTLRITLGPGFIFFPPAISQRKRSFIGRKSIRCIHWLP